VGPVTPLRAQGTVLLRPEPPAPLALQHQRDEQRVLQEALSDDFDVGSLLDTDETLSFRRPGIAPEVSRRLRQGAWTLQAELDLHGLRTEEARTALGQFLRTALQRGLRCVRIVHGKGLGSPGKSPVLKGRVHSWLVQKTRCWPSCRHAPTRAAQARSWCCCAHSASARAMALQILDKKRLHPRCIKR